MLLLLSVTARLSKDSTGFNCNFNFKDLYLFIENIPTDKRVSLQ